VKDNALARARKGVTVKVDVTPSLMVGLLQTIKLRAKLPMLDRIQRINKHHNIYQ